jgi:hypothetical protein
MCALTERGQVPSGRPATPIHVEKHRFGCRPRVAILEIRVGLGDPRRSCAPVQAGGGRQSDAVAPTQEPYPVHPPRRRTGPVRDLGVPGGS